MISEAFTRVYRMSDLYRELLGTTINSLATNLIRSNARTMDRKSLGADRALGMIKAGEKRRPEDRDRLLHSGFKNLFALPDPQRMVLAKRIAVCIFCLDIYDAACYRLGFEVVKNEVQELILRVVERGFPGTRDYFKTLNLYDEKSQEVLHSLARSFGEPLPKEPDPA